MSKPRMNRFTTKIPDYLNPYEMTSGLLSFDDKKCKRCDICTFICPARSITRNNKDKSSLPELKHTAPGIADCIACGCCLAACPEKAISVERSFRPGFYFQRITQTPNMTFPKQYTSARETKAPSYDISSDTHISLKDKIRHGIQSATVAKRAATGFLRYAMWEKNHGRLKDLVNWVLKKDQNDISWATLLEEAADASPDKNFLLYRDETITYREMDNNANRIAQFLLESGYGKGRGLGIFMRNSPRFLDVFFGAQKLGMYLVPINPELKGDGLSYLINHSNIEGLVLDAELLGSILTVKEDLKNIKQYIVDDIEKEAKGISIPDGMKILSSAYEMPAENPGIICDKEDICLIIYTSGTTGKPKGVVYRYKNSSVRILSIAGHLLLDEDDIYYTYLALCHGNALFITTTGTIARRATLALSRKFSASKFWDNVRKYDATIFNTIGSIIPILMKQPKNQMDNQNKVRRVFSAACPTEMWEPFEKRFGVELYEGYGAIDGGGKGIMNLGTAPAGSLGKIPSFVKYKLVDENDMEVPQGVPGELIFETSKNGSSVEYYKNEKASENKSKDGYIRTGDIVREDKHGFIYFIGRNTESMRKGGENVSAYEVEHVIMKHEAVEDVAVYAVPSEMAEDEIMASIKLVDGKTVGPTALHNFLSDKLAKFAVPRYLRFIDTLPKTNTHRVIKRILEEEGVTDDTFDARG